MVKSHEELIPTKENETNMNRFTRKEDWTENMPFCENWEYYKGREATGKQNNKRKKGSNTHTKPESFSIHLFFFSPAKGKHPYNFGL